MSKFFDNVDPSVAKKIGQRYEEMQRLKTQRIAILEHYGIESVDVLKDAVVRGKFEEHPVYEHYLAVLAIDNEIEELRGEIKEIMGCGEERDVSIHKRLVKLLEERFMVQLVFPPELLYDGIRVKLFGNISLHIIYPTEDKYSLSWDIRGSSFRIDTAPLHHGLGTYPNHIHFSNEDIKDDPFTSINQTPEQNLEVIMRELIK